MTELSKENIQQLKSDFPKFKKSFASSVQSAYQDDSFRLNSLTLGAQEDGYLYFSFEYKGQCSLFPGDGRHTDKIKISDITSPNTFFSMIDRVISKKVSESFIKVR